MEQCDKIICEMMGKMVHVVVDRPIGYQHADLIYPVNYGYIPGMTAGDEEDQDVYILGVSEPLSTFDGRVIAVIRRKNDCEDKLVVAPDGMYFHQGQIAEAVHFQEKYFITTIDSIFQKSCGVIPVRQNCGHKEYLILQQGNGSWSFPKGHMESGESEEQTALRELLEESGLTAELVPGTRVSCEYGIPPFIKKQVVLFLGKADGKVILQTSEVMQYRWVQVNELKHYLHKDTYDACKKLLE